jgi:hypothetical protein
MARTPDPETPGSNVMGLLAKLDHTQAELQNEFPGWRIWYVDRPGRITWAAQREPVLNTRSAEDLRAAILKILARNDRNGSEVLEDVRSLPASHLRGCDDPQGMLDILAVIGGEGTEDGPSDHGPPGGAGQSASRS